MTTTNPLAPEAPAPGCPVAHGPHGVPRVPIYTPEFAAEPHRAYREMRRRYGSLVPVELTPGVPATLVIGYRTALRILNDPIEFPADPRAWEQQIPGDCPIRPMMEWRPNALRSSGAEHTRYRSANVTAIHGVDLYQLHDVVEQTAIPLINAFSGAGSADLLGQYAYPLVFGTLNTILGCSPDIGERVAAGMAMIFDTVRADEGNQMLGAALTEHVAQKRAVPGDDITSRLLAHSAGLSDEEMLHQLVTLYGAGIEPMVHLVANTLLLILTDDRFAGPLLDGSLATRDALDEVLFIDPPLANYCISYPRRPVMVDGVWLPAHQPVVISMTACNNDPEVRGAGDITGNRSHLAWSAGPHGCPARDLGYQIAKDACDLLLEALPDISPAVPADQLSRRSGPFHRALEALPVEFAPAPPLPAHPAGAQVVRE